MALHCNISLGDSTQRKGLAPSYGVAVMLVPDVGDKNFAKSVRECCDNVMAQLKVAKGSSIAFPLLLSSDATTMKCLSAMLPAIEMSLDQEERACTVMLFVEQLTSAESKKLMAALKEVLSPPWHEDIGPTSDGCLGQPSQSAIPSILVCGRQKDVSVCQKQIEDTSVPPNFNHHASLLLKFLKDQETCAPRVDVLEKSDEEGCSWLVTQEQPGVAASAHGTKQNQATVIATQIPVGPPDSGCADGSCEEFVTSSGIKVSVYKTDITKLPVGAIVNAANEHLAHGGGVAYAIARAAGFQLEDEGQDYINTHGPLKVTGVAVTTAGSLPCRKVLHAVGPRWYDYEDKAVCQQDLVDTVLNCLQTADDLGFTSLALPSISSAIFGVPKQVCAESYFAAVQKYSQVKGDKRNLKHLHFVDVSDDMVRIIQQTFRSGMQTPAVQQTIQTKITMASTGKEDAPTALDAKRFTTKSGIKISVYKTDITKLPVDAIVNAANEHLAHGGGVAYAIARAAGFPLEDEGQDYINKHGPLKVTGVAVTTAGSLPCRKVLHAVGPRWCDYKDKAVCQQDLVDTVLNCLQTADDLGFTSLALPSISSAIFGVPKQVCAESYFAAVQKYSQVKGDKRNLKHLHFVDVSDDMVRIIQQTFRSGMQTPAVQQTIQTKITMASTGKEDAPTATDAKRFTTKSGIKISVYKTDITKLPVDAIVNAANEHLAHAGGVAYAIARAAGFQLEDEGQDYIRKHGPLKVTGVAVTTAGSLTCRKVLHAVGPRWCDYKDKAVCQEDLVDTVLNCLQTADGLGFTSLALPSISSAIFGVPQQVCAESYLTAVLRFEHLRGSKSILKHIHFVDVSESMVTIIQQIFGQNWIADEGEQRPQKAIGKKVKKVRPRLHTP